MIAAAGEPLLKFILRKTLKGNSSLQGELDMMWLSVITLLLDLAHLVVLFV